MKRYLRVASRARTWSCTTGALVVDEVEVVSDSELLVNQMRGSYKVKNAALDAEDG